MAVTAREEDLQGERWCRRTGFVSEGCSFPHPSHSVLSCQRLRDAVAIISRAHPRVYRLEKGSKKEAVP